MLQLSRRPERRQSHSQSESRGSKWLDRQEVGGAKYFAMASRQHHTVLCCNRSVFVCGRKEYGRLGLGQESEEPCGYVWSPAKVLAVSSGDQHTALLFSASET